jgi:hypothetical protein
MHLGRGPAEDRVGRAGRRQERMRDPEAREYRAAIAGRTDNQPTRSIQKKKYVLNQQTKLLFINVTLNE